MGAMKLQEYLLSRQLDLETFAGMVGSSASAVRKWRAGERTPRRDQMLRIREVTNGAVTADDFLPGRDQPAPGALAS